MTDLTLIIQSNGVKSWHNQPGQLQRRSDEDDGWSVRYSTGERNWHEQGLLHRDGGPAMVVPFSGHREWYQNGLRHREDGPAVIRLAPHEYNTSDTNIFEPEWWLWGVQYTDEMRFFAAMCAA